MVGIDDQKDEPDCGMYRRPSTYGAGIPDAVAALTCAVPFNDAGSLALALDRLEAEGDTPACVILEPVLMLGMVQPHGGYLQAVRELTLGRGIPLIFDEVKSGLSVGPAGAVGRYGVKPDIVVVGKALGGGLPVSAIGAEEWLMEPVRAGAVHQVGTFNGNALGMAAARATLEEVLTESAFAAIEAVNVGMVKGCRGAFENVELPVNTSGIGARGHFFPTHEPFLDSRQFAQEQDRTLDAFVWFFLANRGIYATPARPWQWTISVAHDFADVGRFVAVVEELARRLADIKT
jgi:glutamate-1-semialdehyde 2,1-aminomutase